MKLTEIFNMNKAENFFNNNQEMTRKSYAKVNIFLKIAGKRNDYHEIVSRFVRVKNLFDVMSFQKQSCEEFVLEGDFGCDTKQNTIYKAYLKLAELSPKVELFFKQHKTVVTKKVPEFAGLGGGSSNAATFILMVNDFCKLDIDINKMAEIGSKIGADVPFFIYEYDSANVTGIGEIVHKFDEETLNISTFTPNIKCNTAAIFREFRNKFYKEISNEDSSRLLKMRSIDILKYLTIEDANDLYAPACNVYPELKQIEQKENEKYKIKNYFSGSGSSFFRIIDENK